MSMEYSPCDPLHLPEGIEPEDMVYRWTYACNGVIDKKRLDNMLYMIVPRERHPELYSDDSVEGTISRKGSFLVERPKKVQVVFQKRLNAVNEALTYSEHHEGLSPLGQKVHAFMRDHREEYTKWLLGMELKEVEQLKELAN